MVLSFEEIVQLKNFQHPLFYMRELSHEYSTPTLAGIPDGSCVGTFMISASVVTVILEHPVSPIRQAITDAMFRRFVIGWLWV